MTKIEKMDLKLKGKKSPHTLRAKMFKTNFQEKAALSGWKFYGLLGGMISFSLFMLYPIFVDPVLHVDKYKKMHEENQTEFFQSGVLPGGLKKWEDPWKQRNSSE